MNGRRSWARGGLAGWRGIGRRVAVWGPALAALLAHAGDGSPAGDAGGLPLIPRPAGVEGGGGRFPVSSATVLCPGPGAEGAARLLADSLRDVTGLTLAVSPGPTAGGSLVLRIDPALGRLGAEGYCLTSAATGVTLAAASSTGLLWGVQTLRQLLLVGRPAAGTGDHAAWSVPCAAVEDRPRFAWRGLMLDCSRTFQSIDYLRKTIDRMAFYKLNVLHLHLTDDQGWRLEIRKYPELTAKGARFAAAYHEPPEHEGFYTQDQMRELIAYAAARGVTIVPEIEMPGHSLAALSVFPRLSCAGGPFEIYPFDRGPGITADIFCAGNDETFAFFEDVLAEVAGLFPSAFVHVGGDEAPKERWKACPKCQARMKAGGLKDEQELQSWFIRRAETILARHGKRLIGWDEILEGGLAPNATVMSWRGTRGGVAAAQAGHDVVMSPTSHCYFDYPYGRIDTARAFAFEPVPAGLSGEEAAHVLGLQANFWSHIDREPAKVDRQLYPRLLAIAERGWSPRDDLDGRNFAARVRAHRACLDSLGAAYDRGPLDRAAAAVGGWTPAAVSEGGRDSNGRVTLARE
jgi:hexosaminidase